MTTEEKDNSVKLMLAYLCIAKETDVSLVRKVQVLDRFGLSDKDIAIVCAASVQSIRNARLQLKKTGNG